MSKWRRTIETQRPRRRERPEYEEKKREKKKRIKKRTKEKKRPACTSGMRKEIKASDKTKPWPPYFSV